MGIDPFVGALISGAFSLFAGSEQADATNRQADAMREGAQAQKEAEQAKARIAERENARARIEQAREARIRVASIQASTGASGIGAGTSGVAGSVSSIGSQAGSNIGFINQQETFAGQASAAMQRSADATARAGVASAEGAQWQQIGGLANAAFSQAGGFTTIFGGNTHKAVS